MSGRGSRRCRPAGTSSEAAARLRNRMERFRAFSAARVACLKPAASIRTRKVRGVGGRMALSRSASPSWRRSRNDPDAIRRPNLIRLESEHIAWHVNRATPIVLNHARPSLPRCELEDQRRYGDGARNASAIAFGSISRSDVMSFMARLAHGTSPTSTQSLRRMPAE